MNIEWQYIFTITILTIFMLLYGGVSPNNSITYDVKAISNAPKLTVFKQFLINYSKQVPPKTEKYDIATKLKLIKVFIPNVTNIYFATILPKQILQLSPNTKQYMLSYNFNGATNVELLVETNGTNGYFLELQTAQQQQMTLTDINPIFNGGNETVYLLLVIVKKPFWNKNH